jgi:hypothetical protein
LSWGFRSQRILLANSDQAARRAADDPRFHGHYVTAREMYNLARAAESGWRGSVADGRDFELVGNAGAVAVLSGAAHGSNDDGRS